MRQLPFLLLRPLLLVQLFLTASPPINSQYLMAVTNQRLGGNGGAQHCGTSLIGMSAGPSPINGFTNFINPGILTPMSSIPLGGPKSAIFQ
jgi:hypothetical protein